MIKALPYGGAYFFMPIIITHLTAVFGPIFGDLGAYVYGGAAFL